MSARAEPPALLVLAGTAEARRAMEALAPDAAAGRLRLIASLAGATRAPAALPAEVRSGGFGGAEGLAATLRAERIAALIDALHPFAARMAASAAEACAAAGTPRLKLLRPGWDGADRRFADLPAALAALPPGARALAATGRGSAAAVARAPAGARVWLRVAEDPPPAGVEAIVSRPPHRAEAERALFARLGLSHLIAKDSGGPDDAKLGAARAAGVAVWLIDRPAPPPGPTVADVASAVAWARETLGLRRGGLTAEG